MNVAILGGTFDPFHTSHLNIALFCKYNLNFDEIGIIPNINNPDILKKPTVISHRVNMIKLGISKYSFIKFNDIEIQTVEPKYTYETLKSLTKIYPDYKFSLILGNDNLIHIQQGKYFSKLRKHFPIIFIERTQNCNGNILKKYRGPIFKLNNDPNLSSTDIRNGVNNKFQIQAILQYIFKNNLYIKNKLKYFLNQKRVIHSLNVGSLAYKLAEMYKINSHDAYLAGVFHDLTKSWTSYQHRKYITDLAVLKSNPKIYHSFSGAQYIKAQFKLNENIVNAIRCHTIGGKEQMTLLAQIVYVADKISKERDYPDVEKYRILAYKNIQECFGRLYQKQYQYLKNKISSESLFLQNYVFGLKRINNSK